MAYAMINQKIEMLKTLPSVKAILATRDLASAPRRVYLLELFEMYRYRAPVDRLYEPSEAVTIAYVKLINDAAFADMLSVPPDNNFLEVLYASALRLAIHQLEDGEK